MTKNMDRAICQAEEYERLYARGDVVLADVAWRNVLDLIAQRKDGVLLIPACVADVCLGRKDARRAGMVPASEVQS